MMKPRRESGRNVCGHREHRVLRRWRERGQRYRRHVLTTVVIRRCGLNRHEPRDTVRGERDAGRTNRSLWLGLSCESIDVPDQWRLEIGRQLLVLNEATTDLSSTFRGVFNATRLQLR